MRSEFIDPGEFRTEFTLQRVSLMPDGGGGHQESWTETAAFFARIEPISAASRFGAGQMLETVTHRVTMRHRPDIESGMRLVRQERVFDILTVHDPDETGRYLVCRVREDGR
ncbi:phage head closure protein [Aquamicrobium sp. LC103]|uniref:phage head closure protein n=1 Tax=Aquamicrobium sp. LC103 TaxID=1120658 RepID=UPI00063EA0BA|nr:phage head closure protein [Aquamicrobium sp. LC103]TKT81227.1 head-tail adaptor protein [Aquamicrobium sp. LC103]